MYILPTIKMTYQQLQNVFAAMFVNCLGELDHAAYEHEDWICSTEDKANHASMLKDLKAFQEFCGTELRTQSHLTKFVFKARVRGNSHSWEGMPPLAAQIYQEDKTPHLYAAGLLFLNEDVTEVRWNIANFSQGHYMRRTSDTYLQWVRVYVVMHSMK